VVLWALGGAAIGFLGFIPTALLFAGSFKALFVTGWVLLLFVLIAAFTSAAIPLLAMLRLRDRRAHEWPRFIRRLLVAVAVALPCFIVVAVVVFGIVRSSWQYEHDGVADRFLLSISLATAVVVILVGLLTKIDESTAAPPEGPARPVEHPEVTKESRNR